MNYQQPDRSFRLEQHIGTILQVMVVALLTWSLSTTVSLRTEVGVLQAKVEAMQLTINQGTNDRYRGSDAARDFATVWSELNRFDKRMTNCENKHNGVRQ
jgi:hypothetical protein